MENHLKMQLLVITQMRWDNIYMNYKKEKPSYEGFFMRYNCVNLQDLKKDNIFISLNKNY